MTLNMQMYSIQKVPKIDHVFRPLNFPRIVVHHVKVNMICDSEIPKLGQLVLDLLPRLHNDTCRI